MYILNVCKSLIKQAATPLVSWQQFPVRTNQKIWLLHSRQILGGVVFLSSLSILPTHIDPSSAARAGIFQGYNPPSSFGRIQRTLGAGLRGCSEGQTVSLNLVAPKDHIGTTVSGRPTFLWYISAPAPMRFTLVEPGVAKPLIDKQIKGEKPGIVQLEMPQEAPELLVGKEYRWIASIICNENHPSENIYARTWVKRVTSSPSLEQKLGGATKESELAAVYAQSGIWYDAIATAYKALQKDTRDQLTSKYFLELLEQIGLSNLEAQERK